MNNRQIEFNQKMFERMTHDIVNIKHGKTEEYNPITGITTATWAVDKNVPAYIGRFEQETIQFSDNKLTEAHKKVIVKGEEQAELINDKPVDMTIRNKGYTVFGVIL
jgi:hypothetical protein